MNDTLKTITKRYSCRAFTDKVVNDEDLQAIATAAIHAPSGMNRQGWQVIIVKNKALLTEVEAEGLQVLAGFDDKSTYERIMKRSGKLFYNAQAVVFIAIKEAFPKGAELIDLGIVAQNVSLAATSLGIDNCHCGFVAFCFAGGKQEEFKKKLKFPQGYECGMAMLLGYSKEQGMPHALDKSKISFIE